MTNSIEFDNNFQSHLHVILKEEKLRKYVNLKKNSMSMKFEKGNGVSGSEFMSVLNNYENFDMSLNMNSYVREGVFFCHTR